jgi:hypothetical protein
MVLKRGQRISARFCPVASAQENHGVSQTLSLRHATCDTNGNKKLESSIVNASLVSVLKALEAHGDDAFTTRRVMKPDKMRLAKV